MLQHWALPLVYEHTRKSLGATVETRYNGGAASSRWSFGNQIILVW